MRTGIKLGPRAAAFVAVLIAASAVGILTPTLSNTVSKDVQVTGFAVTLTVDGIPDSVAPGGVFRVIATLANNANRPVPAVLRMEVRNPNNTVPRPPGPDRKSTRLNSSHLGMSYAVFCLKERCGAIVRATRYGWGRPVSRPFRRRLVDWA